MLYIYIILYIYIFVTEVDCETILLAGTIDLGTDSHFVPKRTSAMDSAYRASLVMPQPIWAPDQYLRS
jgi:hypothetical protein